jgi:hypothetical protein
VQVNSKRDVFINGHRKGRRLLKHHAYARAQLSEIVLLRQNVLAVDQHLSFRALPVIKAVGAVKDAQQGRLAAT